jgi:hypothetical protein
MPKKLRSNTEMKMSAATMPMNSAARNSMESMKRSIGLFFGAGTLGRELSFEI